MAMERIVRITKSSPRFFERIRNKIFLENSTVDFKTPYIFKITGIHAFNRIPTAIFYNHKAFHSRLNAGRQEQVNKFVVKFG